MLSRRSWVANSCESALNRETRQELLVLKFCSSQLNANHGFYQLLLSDKSIVANKTSPLSSNFVERLITLRFDIDYWFLLRRQEGWEGATWRHGWRETIKLWSDDDANEQMITELSVEMLNDLCSLGKLHRKAVSCCWRLPRAMRESCKHLFTLKGANEASFTHARTSQSWITCSICFLCEKENLNTVSYRKLRISYLLNDSGWIPSPPSTVSINTSYSLVR